MTADVMRISDWSSDVCSSDLIGRVIGPRGIGEPKIGHQEAGADFGNKLFPGTDCTFFVIIAQRVAGEPACMARCVHQLMTFGCDHRFVAVEGRTCRHIVPELGRAACGVRGVQYVWMTGGAGALKKK